ncbi:acyl carrier protein [Streptomyces sp. NPDC087901]|uniref:acyl carrier protein n=1 Tax=unclassified Streptomyces TaxID=2593676 RepID=UPI00342996F7
MGVVDCEGDMDQVEGIRRVVAESLNICTSDVTDDLAFQSIPEWDSLAHVALMMRLEEVYDSLIDDEMLVELTSVRAIVGFVNSIERVSGATPDSQVKEI